MGTLEDRARLNGRVAVVTGGAGGIGRGISLALASCGVSVALCDRDEVALATVTEELAAIGGDHLTFKAQVRNPEELAAFFAAFDTRFDRLDIAVNVPGGSFVAPFLETRRKGWQAVIEQNFLHVLDVTQAAAERMARHHHGSIITIGSVEGLRAMPKMAVYGAMKWAVEGFTRSMSIELAPLGIRVNSITPDIIPTEATGNMGLTGADRQSDPNDWATTVVVPMGRAGTVDEVGDAVLFLASDLSSYVTGSTLLVDGGTQAAAGWYTWPDGPANMIPPPIADMAQQYYGDRRFT
jgi:3-oxoacyl-[acyl-carrier protein] reductase